MKSAALVVCWLLSSMVCQAAARGGVVRLCGRAGVVGEIIRLSDFLPGETAAAFRDTAALVELGRSPRLGSTRTLSRAQILGRLSGNAELLDRVSIPERVNVVRQGWPIAPESIRKTILNFATTQGWDYEFSFPGEFEISGAAVAVIRDPELEVDTAEQDTVRHQLKFSMRCANNDDCGMFLVSVALPANFADGQKVYAGRGMKAGPRIQREILAHAGQPAMLIMRSGNMTISLRVICLERGSLGQTIRARASNSHRVFHGEVVGKGSLRASL